MMEISSIGQHEEVASLYCQNVPQLYSNNNKGGVKCVGITSNPPTCWKLTISLPDHGEAAIATQIINSSMVTVIKKSLLSNAGYEGTHDNS